MGVFCDRLKLGFTAALDCRVVISCARNIILKKEKRETLTGLICTLISNFAPDFFQVANLKKIHFGLNTIFMGLEMN